MTKGKETEFRRLSKANHKLRYKRNNKKHGGKPNSVCSSSIDIELSKPSKDHARAAFYFMHEKRTLLNSFHLLFPNSVHQLPIRRTKAIKRLQRPKTRRRGGKNDAKRVLE